MKLTLQKDDLIKGLETVQNIVFEKMKAAICHNVLLTANVNRLELETTNLDVQITCNIKAEVKSPGIGTLPVKRLLAVVNELDGPEIEMEFEKNNVCSIRSGATVIEMNGLDANEFPTAQPLKDFKIFAMPQAKLKSMLRQISFAMSEDETMFFLCGVFFSLKGTQLEICATDGRRMAIADCEFDNIGPIPDSGFILPAKTVNELSRLLLDTFASDVKIAFDVKFHRAMFTFTNESSNDITLESKLVKENYPNYRQIVPSPMDMKERVVIGREELLKAISRANLLTSDKAVSVKLSFDKNVLQVSASSEFGKVQENITILYKGEPITIKFNPQYLIEPLAVSGDDSITLQFIDATSLFILKTECLNCIRTMRIK